jgi:hypothetical protein
MAGAEAVSAEAASVVARMPFLIMLMSKLRRGREAAGPMPAAGSVPV